MTFLILMALDVKPRSITRSLQCTQCWVWPLKTHTHPADFLLSFASAASPPDFLRALHSLCNLSLEVLPLIIFKSWPHSPYQLSPLEPELCPSSSHGSSEFIAQPHPVWWPGSLREPQVRDIHPLTSLDAVSLAPDFSDHHLLFRLSLAPYVLFVSTSAPSLLHIS